MKLNSEKVIGIKNWNGKEQRVFINHFREINMNMNQKEEETEVKTYCTSWPLPITKKVIFEIMYLKLLTFISVRSENKSDRTVGGKHTN